MQLPLIALLLFVVSLLVYVLASNTKVVEVARAGVWVSLFVIAYANLAIHVIRL